MEVNMYYTIQILERNGEQEYGYDFLIKADDIEEATEKADNHVKTWYMDPNVFYDVETDEYMFFGGSIAVGYAGPHRTTKKAFIEMITNQYMIR
jgi:ATP-dependent Zn protease